MIGRKNYNISFAIIIINVTIFLLSYILLKAQIVRLDVYMVLNPTLFLKYKHYWSPISYMFAHANISHLFFNMFAIFVFGHSIEDKMGSVGFTIYYLITGALAGVFSLVIYTVLNINVLLLGASGAIYALLFAYAVFYPNRKLYIFGLIPISPPILILLYAGFDIYSQIFGSSGVAHITHLSGFLFAYFYFKVVFKINPIFILKNYKRYN